MQELTWASWEKIIEDLGRYRGADEKREEAEGILAALAAHTGGEAKDVCGLWRCTSVTFAEGEVDDHEAVVEAEDEALGDLCEEWSSEKWRAAFPELGPGAYFLEIRENGRFAEADLSLYPLTRIVQEFDPDTDEPVEAPEETQASLAVVRGALGFEFCYDGSYDYEGEVYALDGPFNRSHDEAPEGKTRLLLRQYDGGEHVYDFVELREGKLHRRATVLNDGRYASVFRMVYEPMALVRR